MKKGDLFFPLLCAFFAGAYLIESWDYPWKSGIFPWGIIGIIFFLVLTFFIKELVKWALKSSQSPRPSEKRALTFGQCLRSREFRNALILCAGIFFYFALAQSLGFIITNMLIVGGLMRLLGAKWRRSVIVALCLTIVLHFFFREYLHVPFPRGPGEMLYYWVKYRYFT